MSLKILLFIGCGSFIGGVLRYSLSRAIQAWAQSPLPWGTLLVNILGCTLLGALSALLTERVTLSEAWRLGLTVGLCGGFTTFSTFSHELLMLLHRGAWLHALSYSAGSFALCMIGVISGYYLVARL